MENYDALLFSISHVNWELLSGEKYGRLDGTQIHQRKYPDMMI
jgi:hypothetical protein